jgi:hypothetical protein
MNNTQKWKVIAAAIVAGALALPGHAQSVLTPTWLQWLGDGTNSYNCASGTCNVTGELWVT